MQIINEDVSQEVSGLISNPTMPLSQAKQIYTDYKNKELNMPYEIPEEHKTERVVLGTLQRFGQSMEVLPEGIGILGGEIMMLDGKILQNTPFKDVAQANMKLGEKMIMGANSSLEAKRKRQAQELLPMTEEELSSPLSKSISTVTDYGSQILLALATGGTISLATMGARMAGETAVQGLEQYKIEHPEDKDLTGFLTTGNLSKEVLLNAGKTAVNLYVEKAIGVPKQVSQFKKALKTPAIGAMGVLKAAGKGYAMGFGEEWATETIQGITDTTFDAFLGRYKDAPELAKAYNEAVVDAVYAGIFGGGFGAAGHVLARGKAISNVKEMMSNVVPAQDLEMVATAIVDNHIASTKQMIGTQIQLSTELRDKHGEIYNALNVAAKQAMMESGVANTMTEDEIAQHASELSELFADQVLAEATKRNEPIYDVVNGQDIVYDAEKKELRLAPKTEERARQRAFMQAQDVAQRINEIDAEEAKNGVPEYTAPTININGVERQTTNSDGTPIAKSEKSLRYFYDWFGDSKVVDKQGRPFVVYHGGKKGIQKFNKKLADTGMFFFTNQEGLAEEYRGYNEQDLEKTDVYAVYLNVKNPLVLTGRESLDTFADIIHPENELLRKKWLENEQKRFDEWIKEYRESSYLGELAIMHREKIAEYAEKNGYDGVFDYEPTTRGAFADDRFGYIVFNSNQIKSIDNRGTFSGSPNIYLQTAYHGTPTEVLEGGGFSLEKIGSGEGAQVHGHGLYYTATFNIADIRYRKRLLEHSNNPVALAQNLLAWKTKKEALKEIRGRLDMYKDIIKYSNEAIKSGIEIEKNKGIVEYNESLLKAYKEAGKLIETKSQKQIEKIQPGQVYEVDIPENPYLIDEQGSYEQQPEIVKRVFDKISKEFGVKTSGEIQVGANKQAITGKYVYNHLSDKLGSQKNASEWLEKNGVKGITYVGQQDGRCFVIFNPDDVKVIQKFYQITGLPKEKKTPKGTFDANSKVIKLFEKADASTLDHELSHFWLDNMWTYATSGAASEQYMAQFNAVKDFLGVRPDQRYLTRQQHEKFASAYEKYIYRGELPTSMMGNVFDNYERFIRNVYDSINDIRAEGKNKFNLTPEIINFFDSMIRGGIDTTAATESITTEVRNEEAQKADTETMKEVKSVVDEMPEREVQPEIKPVQVEGEKKESRLYERMKGIVGDEGKVEYNVANIQEQREKAREMWNNNPEKAKAILAGKEVSDDILRQALYTEQQRLALENGDTNTFLNSLRKQTAEATRMGQELSALRGVVEDITDPAYWIRSAETEALKNLAKKQSKNLQNAMGNTPLMELTSRLDADIKALQKDVASKATDEEKMKTLKDGVKALADKYQGLDQPETVFNQIDWDNEELANDYIENKVKEKLGIALPKDTAKAFIQTARELDTLSKQRDDMGNPTEAFFVKKDELERMRNSHTPTSRAKVLISTIGRANMLTAPSTSVLNVVSNSLNYSAENVVRKVGNLLEGKTNDNIVDDNLVKKYREKAWKVFWDTGYDMSFMNSLLDERLYKGESVSHSEGDGAIRAVGRFAEKYVFSRLISSPDIYFKSVLGFTNFVGNEATDMAYEEGLTGEKAKARADALFKDAIKIEPETEQGQQIRAKAQTDALILTFQQDTKFARMLLDVRNAINKGTGDIGIGDIMSPFIKTPANIISMGFDAAVGPFASPVNLLGALTDIKNKNYRSARVLQAAKQTTTAALAYTVIGLLASMLIDDDDYIPDYAQLTAKERAAVRAKGGSFGSIKVGGEYISTDFFGPFEMPLVTFLNTRRTGNLLKGIAGGVISKGVDAPVLKDVLGSSESLKELATSKDDIISAVGENVANAAITRLTPNALNTIAKILDGKERKANTVAEKILARIPFARHTLEERVSVATGEAQTIQQLNMLLVGARGRYEETAPLAQELGRLASVGESVNIIDPTRTGVLAKLTDKEKSAIQNMFAKEFAQKASKEIMTASYRNKSDENKKEALDDVRKEVVNDIKRKYRKQIKVLQKGKK